MKEMLPSRNPKVVVGILDDLIGREHHVERLPGEVIPRFESTAGSISYETKRLGSR